MRATLVVPDRISERIDDALENPVETGAVLAARVARTPRGDLRLLATDYWPVPDEAYRVREIDELVVASEGYVPPLSEIEATGAVPIWMHTHPGNGSSAIRSDKDMQVDAELTELFRTRTGSDYYGALIFARSDSGWRFTGLLDDGARESSMHRLWKVGPGLKLIAPDDAPVSESTPRAFDRQVRAFGADIQRVIGGLTIAVVGCGGTGSAVSEQLVRLGARDLLLFDPDRVSESNITRLYGSTADDVGRPKVDVVAEHALRIAPDAEINTWAGSITEERVARQLVEADLVFGCTDDNAGRLVLSRFSTFYATPVIDVGVILTSSPEGTLDGIHGRVTVLHPGAACLVCRGRIDVRRASAELMEPDERVRLAEEGYAPGLPGVEPAVVSYTTMVASIAVSELIERLIHFGPRPVPSEILARIHDREVSTNRALPQLGHYCSAEASIVGKGDCRPFLEQVWVK